jgi:GrpB-like predicted nucleotidyltransferase (UPF0157 family)
MATIPTHRRPSTMTLAFLDTQPDSLDPAGAAAIELLAPRHYQSRAVSAYEDAELLLTAILPDARVEHVGAAAIPGAYSRGGVDVCVAVPRETFEEALGVLGEAGFTIRAQAPRTEPQCVLDAPAADVALALRLTGSGPRFERFVRFRDALRDNAALLARYNAIRIAAAAQGKAAYREAKAEFIERVLTGA